MTRWTFFAAVAALCVQHCSVSKSCSIWTSAGPVVRRGSSFQVFCTFSCRCRGDMNICSGHPPTEQSHRLLNATTIYHNLTNITEDRTFSCSCKCSPAPRDPCGLDISAGYLPERPENMSCIYEVNDDDGGVVVCTWNSGRDTFMPTRSALWVRTGYENHTNEPVQYKGTGTGWSSADFLVSGSVRRISVWVEVRNALGSAASVTMNYTLWGIARPGPPALGRPECSSRGCVLKAERSALTRHLEVQYGAAERPWTSSPEPTGSGAERSVSVSPLEPYTGYHFRARSKFSTGLWSQWSANVSGWTQEEAPAKELDVWFAESASDFGSLMVYWKQPDVLAARGRISGFRVRVDGRSGPVFTANVSADVTNQSVPFCPNCEVKVWAYNSRGPSPPARITTHHTRVKVQQVAPPQDVQVTAGNRSVAISWRKRATAPPHAAHVVEWYPQGLKLEELRWVRLTAEDHHTVITGIEPFECYEGAVHVVCNGSSVSSTRFTDVATLTSAPSAGPSLQETVEGNQVTVTWTEIPRGQRGGCITEYTVYLSKEQKRISVPASERRRVIRNLSPADYSLWMTASTARGEGPAGQKVNFFIRQDTPLYPLVLCAVAATVGMVLMCLYHNSAVKQRVWVFLQCLMLDVVPDPANSKWARASSHDTGEVDLRLPPSSAGGAEEEEEPILVDVEELPPMQSGVPSGGQAEPAGALHPPTDYLKSVSYSDSESSDLKQSSLDTGTTVDYIASLGLGSMEEEKEEEEEEEEEEEFTGMMGFFPSHNMFTGPMQLGGKLTLNAVKIDCSDFFLPDLCHPET